MLYEGLSRINAQRLCQLHIQLCETKDLQNHHNLQNLQSDRSHRPFECASPISLDPVSLSTQSSTIPPNLHSSSKHPPKMTLEGFYERHKGMINATVFEDSYNSFHFWGFISESIKKSHTNLPYILRNQYSNADRVFSELREAVTGMKSKEEGSLTQAIFDLPEDVMRDFVKDVYRYIILQPLYRHHIYSPIMCLLVLIDIMHHAADVYIHKSLGMEGKKKMSMYMDAPLTRDQINNIQWMSEIEKEMLTDECEVHIAQIKKNRKR